MLNELRRSRRIDQKSLADMIGLSHCYLSSIENGRKNPPKVSKIIKICESLSLSDSESNRLLESAEISRRVIRLPDDLSIEEYQFVGNLRARLGSLSSEELEAMGNILKLGDKLSREVIS